MVDALNPHAANLLKAEYGPHVKPLPVAAVMEAFAPPSADLIHQLHASAMDDFGIPMSAVADWTAWLTQVMAAIAGQHWLALFPLALQLTSYVPQALAFIRAIIAALHGQPTPAPGGPTITG